MIKKSNGTVIFAILSLVAVTACTRQDSTARNVIVPERSESNTADIERREEGMTGATNTTDQNDASSMHSDRRKAARTGEQNKGLSTTSETDAAGNTSSGTTGATGESDSK